MRFLNSVCITIAILSAAFIGGHLTAGEAWIETESFFTWETVPNALGNPEPGNPDVALEPWYINTRLVIRRGDFVTFEAASPDGQYVQFYGNCQTTQILPQFVGEFLSLTRVRYYPSAAEWQVATDWQAGLLQFACNAT
ncbi:hypothetical protein [Egbenema bharatensis]|uniref:hypothetical protein n=1 Tax=Egbenema bharatensis TaxID=3463334 RepID=UPI003A851C62